MVFESQLKPKIFLGFPSIKILPAFYPNEKKTYYLKSTTSNWLVKKYFIVRYYTVQSFLLLYFFQNFFFRKHLKN